MFNATEDGLGSTFKVEIYRENWQKYTVLKIIFLESFIISSNNNCILYYYIINILSTTH